MTYLGKNTDYKEWIDNAPNRFDLGVCLHTPKQMQAAEHGYDDIWLSKKVRRYLNELDRRLFRTQHRKYGKRLPRFVVLGYTDTVGWHAHLLIATPPALSAEKLLPMMKLLWERHMAVTKSSNRSFKDRLFWGEPISGGYGNYSIDNANDYPGTTSGAIISTAKNGTLTHNNGVVDILNCHF